MAVVYQLVVFLSQFAELIINRLGYFLGLSIYAEFLKLKTIYRSSK
jgi:hypothetical protein